MTVAKPKPLHAYPASWIAAARHSARYLNASAIVDNRETQTAAICLMRQLRVFRDVLLAEGAYPEVREAIEMGYTLTFHKQYLSKRWLVLCAWRPVGGVKDLTPVLSSIVEGIAEKD